MLTRYPHSVSIDEDVKDDNAAVFARKNEVMNHFPEGAATALGKIKYYILE